MRLKILQFLEWVSFQFFIFAHIMVQELHAKQGLDANTFSIQSSFQNPFKLTTYTVADTATQNLQIYR